MSFPTRGAIGRESYLKVFWNEDASAAVIIWTLPAEVHDARIWEMKPCLWVATWVWFCQFQPFEGVRSCQHSECRLDFVGFRGGRVEYGRSRSRCNNVDTEGGRLLEAL